MFSELVLATETKLTMLTRHLRKYSDVFREKCTFHMDNIIKEYLFLIWISLFKSRNVKLSIDRFLKTVRQVAWVSVNCWDAFHRNRDGRKRLLFVLFNSTTFRPFCECTQIKVQFWIMSYSFLHEQKLCFFCFHCYQEKCAVIVPGPPCHEVSL